MPLFLGNEKKIITTSANDLKRKQKLESRYYFTNWVPKSINQDGTIYNEVGYKDEWRLSSSGAEKELKESTVFGFIPCTEKDIIRMSGVEWMPTQVNDNSNNCYSYISFYDKDFTLIGSVNCYRGDTNLVSNISKHKLLNQDKSSHSITIDKNGIISFNISYQDGESFNYIRLSAQGKGENAIVTINEEIHIL